MTLLLSIILILSLIGISMLALNLLRLKKELAVAETERARNSEVHAGQITELTESNRELELKNKKLQELQSAQEEQIVNLKNALKPDSFDGFFPICSNCKDIRDPKGYWHSIEEYVESLSDADLSHSLCPECAKKLYPDLFDGDKKAICLKWKPGSDTPM
ncbi:MAG: hypothetical protein WCO84_07510 [bacterium]